MYFVYNGLLTLAAPFVYVAAAFPRFQRHRERLGRYPAELPARLRGRRVIWVHNASVGELLAAIPLLRALRARVADAAVVLSSTSFAGRDLASKAAEADAAVLLPLDLPWAIERALATLRPSLFVFTETEIWPNLLRALARRGVPTVLVSGRISPRSFPRYRWVGRFIRRVLGEISFLGMQSEAEADRVRALGAPAERIAVTGSLKLEGLIPAAAFAIDLPGPLWIAASTHGGEEEICIAAYASLRQRFPDLSLLLAPRHLGRLPDVEALLARAGVAYVRRSALDGAWRGAPDVLLLDTLGELAGLYARAAVAFVGGTLVPVGGHNLLEPARAGVPTLFGPHVESVAETAAALEAKGGCRRVGSGEELESTLGELLATPETRRRMGEAARLAAASGGAVEKSLEAVTRFLA